MGLSDFIGEKCLQIKCTPNPGLKHYDIGEQIPLEDGLYLTLEGWFVIQQKHILCEGMKVWDKWGNQLDCYDLIERNNPIFIAIEKMEKEIKNEKAD